MISLSTNILTVMSRCKHFRIAKNLGDIPFFHDDPQIIAVHGVKRGLPMVLLNSLNSETDYT